jgi:hypothetical protein
MMTGIIPSLTADCKNAPYSSSGSSEYVFSLSLYSSYCSSYCLPHYEKADKNNNGHLHQPGMFAISQYRFPNQEKPDTVFRQGFLRILIRKPPDAGFLSPSH